MASNPARPDDCDCWVDGLGAWQLGPKCHEKERQQWKDMMEKIPDVIEQLRNADRAKPVSRFRTVDGKIKLVTEYVNPNDEGQK